MREVSKDGDEGGEGRFASLAKSFGSLSTISATFASPDFSEMVRQLCVALEEGKPDNVLAVVSHLVSADCQLPPKEKLTLLTYSDEQGKDLTGVLKGSIREDEWNRVCAASWEIYTSSVGSKV